MCGRFPRHSTVNDNDFVCRIPGLTQETQADLSSRYNIAPSQALLLARNGEEGDRQWVTLTWGFLPHWATEPKMRRPINARADTVHQRPFFRTAFKHRRCLIAADGYYEWQKPASGRGPKQLHDITLKSGGPFACACIWERCQLEDFTI